MRLSIFTVVFFALIVSGIFAGDAWAVKLGPVDVHPYLSLSTNFDDNVFVRDNNRREDWFLLISPGIMLERQKGDNLLQLEYRADIFRYLDTGNLNDVEDHYLRAAAYFNTDGRLWFKLDDLADYNHERRDEAFVSSATLNRYYSNDLSTEVGYELTDKLGMSMVYSNFVIDYTNNMNDYRDRVDHAFSPIVRFRILPKTKLLFQGAYKDIYHSHDTDPRGPRLNSEEFWLMTGVTWEITNKSTGTVKVGYEWKDFDHTGVEDYESPVYIVSLNHRFTPKTSVTVSGNRQAKETDDPGATYYTTTGGAVRLNLKPVTKVEVSPYFSYNNNRYSGASTILATGERGRRIENVYSTGLDVNYNMNKWLSVGLGYQHTKKSSTMTNFNYTRNQVNLMLRGTL